MTETKRASLEDLRAMRDRGETARPDTHTESHIGGDDLPDDFWDTATPYGIQDQTSIWKNRMIERR
jgi:hypothetical protein